MAQNITSSGSTAVASNAYAILIQVNAALTGNIVVATSGSTQYGTSGGTVGTITNPTVGSQFKYGGLNQQGYVTVNPSATCDISVTLLSHL